MSIHSSHGLRASALWATVAVAALTASQPNATLIQPQGPVAFTGSDTVTATRSGVGSTSASKSSTFASKSISQFNGSTGVLTGVTVTVTSNRNETAVLSASGG